MTRERLGTTTPEVRHDPPSPRCLTVLFTGAKGGVGTSTVAALHALALARAGFPTTLTALDDDQMADLAGLLGIVTPEERAIDVNAVAGLAPSRRAAADSAVGDPVLRLDDETGGAYGHPYAAGTVHTSELAMPTPHIVIDGGTDSGEQSPVSEHYLVTRACYLALRRAVGAPRRPHGVVLVVEPERSLTMADVESVLGVPVVATIPVEAATARLIDAGLLTTAPRTLRRLRLAWVR